MGNLRNVWLFNGNAGAGGQAGGPIALFGQYAKGFAGVVRAGAFHKADAAVFHNQMDGVIAGINIIAMVGVQRDAQLGAVIAIGQHGNQTGPGSRMAETEPQHPGGQQNDDGKQNVQMGRFFQGENLI